MNTVEGEPIVGYLVFDDFDTALARADSEGSACNLPYFQGTGASRYRTYPGELTNGKWALRINNYSILTEEEIGSVVQSVNFKLNQ
jgi:hypothetical protein|tara:strand:+ start:12205 stop:12462 length:258 start_codon:yes stop_codon:yes gene_type:complete